MAFKGKGRKDDFPGEIYKGEYKGTNLYSMIIRILNGEPEKFDSNHEDICDAIVSIAGQISYVKEKEFYYGQAQKWLNMTLKYMYLTGLWKNKFSELEESLHIPLDKYILKANFCNGKTRKNLIEEKLVKDNAKNFNFVDAEGKIILNSLKDYGFTSDYKNNGGKTVDTLAWSKINNYSDYKILQGLIRDSCIPDDMPPLEWENKIWLESARLENKT